MNVLKSIILSVPFLLFMGSCIFFKLSKEHEEARNVELKDIDFSTLKNGKYIGNYEGGMYKWRENECKVTIDSGKVVHIELINSSDPGGENTKHSELYKRVIQKQSLHVDAISGATLTSKAYLKGVEDALLKAK